MIACFIPTTTKVYRFEQRSSGTWKFNLESDQNLAERDAALTAIAIEDRTAEEGRDIAWIATSSGQVIRMELANPETGKEQGLVKTIPISGHGASEIKVSLSLQVRLEMLLNLNAFNHS